MQTYTETAHPLGAQVPLSELPQRVVLHGVSWATYERLLADFQDSHAAHFAYDRGRLEIRVLCADHEENKDLAEPRVRVTRAVALP